MNTNYGTEIPEEDLREYMGKLTGRIFKIIPLREEMNSGFSRYVEGLIQELLGLDLILEKPIGIELISNIQVMLELYTFKEVRKQVFKCLDILEKMMVMLEVDV